jgi:cell division control protein 7
MYLRGVPEINAAFDLMDRIGRGTFGTTFLAVSKINKIQYALKYLVPTSSIQNIMSEIKALKTVQNPNIVKLLAVARHLDQVVLIFPYVRHDNFKSLLQKMNLKDIKAYVYQLLNALSCIHFHGIIHRDVKPSNYLFDNETKLGKLIDFGLVQFIPGIKEGTPQTSMGTYKKRKGQHNRICSHPSNSVCHVCLTKAKKQVPHSGTPGYRAPEVLLQYRYQNAAIDIWSCGVMLLSLLTHIF